MPMQANVFWGHWRARSASSDHLFAEREAAGCLSTRASYTAKDQGCGETFLAVRAQELPWFGPLVSETLEGRGIINVCFFCALKY